MTDNEIIFVKIYKALDQIAKLKALDSIQSEGWSQKPNGEKIFFLHKLGFESEDISIIVGTTIGTVQKEISVRKKQDNK